MLTRGETLAKLEHIEQRYAKLRFEKLADIAVEMCETRAHFRREPDRRAKVRWRPAQPGTRWGGSGITAWFRGDATPPERWQGKRLFVRAQTGGETLLFVNGEPHGVFDEYHPVVMLTNRAVAGRRYRLDLETYAGHSFPGCMTTDEGTVVGRNSRTFDGVELLLERTDVSAFVFDLRVLRQLAGVLDENSLRRARVARELALVFAAVNAIPEQTSEESWRPKLASARRIMQPLLALKNGPTTPWFGIIGHSHLDTAWLWPLSEAVRKAARTFSSALNLMAQYPEMLFVQSSPCHTDMIRQAHPGLFRRVRRKVAAGRWELTGGMWVEPDCNVPSGESFVRQLLLGQATTREMFGCTADTAWLPDTFGYSAALPQIFRGGGIEFFCTTKMAWNDTTRFPYDTFHWEGIDGTSVLAHFCDVQIYPSPEHLTEKWKAVAHKDVQDRRLLAYGYGDGGGGPTAEILEIARRMADLEGCPRTRHMRVSDFMKSLRDELGDLPRWSGELYLEGHRGTLTSIARIKRLNRKTELALRDAELLWTLAALRRGEYPRAELGEAWKTLLTNQFHDILPGSSIAEVNDEATKQLESCLGRARKLSVTAVESLAGPAPKQPPNLLIVNTLSWERGGEIVLDGVPGGGAPGDERVRWQRIEDVQGRPKLVIAGLTIPALGAVTLPLRKRRARRDSPFTVSGNRVETPHARVRFDRPGRIASLVDKSTGREVVRAGGVLNTFLIGEDVPRYWDNWDIDADQVLKMRTDDRLRSREVVADGPLQLRLRGTYRLGSGSTVTQDMVFHATTPRIDFETIIDWTEKHQLLKVGFDLNVHADAARHEIQFGHIERPTHQNLPQDRARFEVCAHKWTDLSENDFGVALLNDCKYGVSTVGSSLRLSLIKSGRHPDPRGDEGRHVFTYALLPHAGSFSVESVIRPAYELNVDPLVFPVGPRASGFESLLSVDAPNVIVECVKWAERGTAFVLRLYEAARSQTNVTLRFNAPVKAVSETNLLEERPRRLALRRGAVRFAMRPFEVKTLRCAL